MFPFTMALTRSNTFRVGCARVEVERPLHYSPSGSNHLCSHLLHPPHCCLQHHHHRHRHRLLVYHEGHDLSLAFASP